MFSILLKEGSESVTIRRHPFCTWVFQTSLSVITERWLLAPRGVADGCSAGLIDVAQDFGGEVGECGVAVDGHEDVGAGRADVPTCRRLRRLRHVTAGTQQVLAESGFERDVDEQ